MIRMLPSRIKRVEEQVKEEISFIVHRMVKDPRVNKFITITKVKVAKDLRTANIYFTLHDESEENINEALEALDSASGFIRHELGKRVSLRYIPAPRFFYDETLSNAMRIDSIINELHREED